VTRLMPPKRGNQKPKGNGQPKRKNPANREKQYNDMRNQQAQRWRNESQQKGSARQNQTIRSIQPRTQGQVGNAIRVRMPTVGMSDLMQHRITWVAGTVYIGNGTLGATNGVYQAAQNPVLLYTAGTGGGFWLPFAPADADVGSTYGASIMKLYRRLRIRQAKVHLLTIQSSTTNNAVIGVAPCRGPPGAAEFSSGTTGTPAAQTLQNLMSISGMKSIDSFENGTLDLTPYIAGGAGAQQNEFAVANSIAQTSDEGQVLDPIGVIPCAFQIAGNSTVAALQGSVTHNIVCEMVCDLLDFVGAVPVIDPTILAGRKAGFVRGRPRQEESREEKRARLLGDLSALAREDAGARHRSPTGGKGDL
jgi:hypothetical protein